MLPSLAPIVGFSPFLLQATSHPLSPSPKNGNKAACPPGPSLPARTLHRESLGSQTRNPSDASDKKYAEHASIESG